MLASRRGQKGDLAPDCSEAPPQPLASPPPRTLGHRRHVINILAPQGGSCHHVYLCDGTSNGPDVGRGAGSHSRGAGASVHVKSGPQAPGATSGTGGSPKGCSRNEFYALTSVGQFNSNSCWCPAVALPPARALNSSCKELRHRTRCYDGPAGLPATGSSWAWEVDPEAGAGAGREALAACTRHVACVGHTAGTGHSGTGQSGTPQRSPQDASLKTLL